MKFVENNQPGFDIINIFPAAILGRNEMSTSLDSFSSGTNRYPLNGARGIENNATPLTATVHVNDCAAVHVLVLNSDIKGNQDFIASAGDVNWDDVNGIAKREGVISSGRKD